MAIFNLSGSRFFSSRLSCSFSANHLAKLKSKFLSLHREFLLEFLLRLRTFLIDKFQDLIPNLAELAVASASRSRLCLGCFAI